MKNKLFKSLLIAGMLIGSTAIAQADAIYVKAPDGTTGQTGTADQFGINWAATSNYFDSNGSGSLDFGDTVVDSGSGNINGLLVGGVPQVGGFLDNMNNSWNLNFEYNNLTGVVVSNPDNQNIAAHYTSGQIRVYYDAPASALPGVGSLLVMTLDVYDSNAQIFNAIFNTHIDFTGADIMAQNMFFFEDGRNMYDMWLAGEVLDADIDTNLDGPFIQDCTVGSGCDWTRFSTLNGSATFIPEPSVLALLGGGLLLMGFTRRGKKVN